MSAHLGFRVLATKHVNGCDEAENFEVRQAAIDCAQLLAENGWKNIRCMHVTSRIKQYESDSAEEYTPIEWQCHFIGGTA